MYYVPEHYFFSAAVYEDTLYTSEFEMFPGPTYAYGFRVFDFSNPSSLTLLRYESRDAAAYHLRVLGDTLIECDTSFVEVWNLDTPTEPVFEGRYYTQARACALDKYNHLVTNGDVFQVDGHTLERIATFDPVYGQGSGFPYGTAVNSEFVFLAQYPRVLALEIGTPTALHVDSVEPRARDSTEMQFYRSAGLRYDADFPFSVEP
jgi:hypothetical protein